jgi:hypothetical protein
MKKTTAKNTKPVRKVPAKKPAIKPTLTTIMAQIDTGFGNTLYLRGEGSGLSWDKGIVMDCVADDRWVVALSDATTPVTFKFLLNDITWCVGNDYVVTPGESVTVVPSFQGA